LARSSSKRSDCKHSHALEAARYLVAAAGAVVLTITGSIRPDEGLIALVLMSVPTHAGRIVELFRGKSR